MQRLGSHPSEHGHSVVGFYYPARRSRAVSGHLPTCQIQKPRQSTGVARCRVRKTAP